MTERKTETCTVPGCWRPEAGGDAPGWCAEHVAVFDAQSEHEAWEWAREILEPWVETTRNIGSDELTKAMEIALGHVEDRVTIVLEKRETARAALEKEPGA